MLEEKRYRLLEMLLDRFQWVRRRAKGYWVKHSSGPWVKFTDLEAANLIKMGIDFKKDGYTVEDWRENV